MTRLSDPNNQQFEVVPKRDTAEVAELVVGTETMDRVRAVEAERREARRRKR